MAPRKNADKASSPQKAAKPVKKKEKKVKVEKPKLKVPSIIKLKITTLKKEPTCEAPESSAPKVKLTAKQERVLDFASRKIDLANEVALANLLKPGEDKQNFLAKINKPVEPLKIKLKKVKKTDKAVKQKRGRPKKVVSEFFSTSTTADDNTETNDPNTKVETVLNNSPQKKRIRKKKINPDFTNLDTTSDISYEAPKKTSTKKTSTAVKKSPKVPKANKKKSECVAKKRIRKTSSKIKGKLAAEMVTSEVESPLQLDNEMKTTKPLDIGMANPSPPKSPSLKSSRDTSVCSECPSWTKDISSSASSCVTVAPNDIVRIEKRVPIVQLTNIDQILKPDLEKYCSDSDSTSGDSVTKCSVTNSLSNSVSRSLNLSRSSSSSSSSTKPSTSPLKSSNLDNFDPKKLIDFEFLKKLAQGDFELNERDRMLINDPEWPEAEKEIMQCCQDIKNILRSDFLDTDEPAHTELMQEEISEPGEASFERGASNPALNVSNLDNNDSNARIFEKNENFKANKVVESHKTSETSHIMEENLEPAEIIYEYGKRDYEQESNSIQMAFEKSCNTKEHISKLRNLTSLQRTIRNDTDDLQSNEHNPTHLVQECDRTFEEPFQSPTNLSENGDRAEWYRQRYDKSCVTDDDDVLSLMAESITGLEVSKCSNNNVSVCAKPPAAVECMPKLRNLMSIDCNPFKTENNNNTKLVRNDQNASLTPLNRDIEGNFEQDRQPFNNFQQTYVSEIPFQFQRHNSKGAMMLATLYTQSLPTKCHFLRGVCYFNLISNCRRSQCKFPHRTIDAAEALNRMTSCDNATLIGDYLLIRGSPILRRQYGHCFVYEFERRKLTRALVEMVMDFTCRARADNTEDYNLKILITENVLEHLNQVVDLNTISDLLLYTISANEMVCDLLMERIAETQNFSRFKPVFLKLAEFMRGIYRMFSLSVASQIMERVCILPCEPALIRAVWLLVMNTDNQIFRNSNMQKFEELVQLNLGEESYERLMAKKEQVLTDRQIVSNLANQEIDLNLAGREQEKRYMSDCKNVDIKKHSLVEENLNKPIVQTVIRKGLFKFTAPKLSNFKIPNTSSKSASMEYRSPLQASSLRGHFRGRQRGFQPSKKNNRGYNNGPKNFLHRAGPGDY